MHQDLKEGHGHQTWCQHVMFCGGFKRVNKSQLYTLCRAAKHPIFSPQQPPMSKTVLCSSRVYQQVNESSKPNGEKNFQSQVFEADAILKSFNTGHHINS